MTTGGSRLAGTGRSAYKGTDYGTGPDASDSEGEAYCRTSRYMHGLGYATDLAFYPGYSDSWYMAATGQAIYTDWKGDWAISGEWSGEAPWTPHFFD